MLLLENKNMMIFLVVYANIIESQSTNSLSISESIYIQRTRMKLQHNSDGFHRFPFNKSYYNITLCVQSASSPSVSTSGEPSQSQTDESKAQNSSTAEATNVEDERKQQAARTPCFADTGKCFTQLIVI